MKSLVTGANGFIGSHLCKSLLDLGHVPSIMVRRSSDISLLRKLAGDDFDGINVLYGDVTDPNSLDQILGEHAFDVIYNLFGAIKGSRLADFEKINVDGAINVCDSIIRNKRSSTCVVFLSSIAAAGPGKSPRKRGEEEPTTVLRGDFYGISKWKMEEALKEYYPQLRITVVRCPGVYGAGDPVSFGLFKLAKAGFVSLIGVGPQYQSVLDVRDLCSGLLRIPEVGEANHETFYFTSDDELTWLEIQKRIAKGVFDKKILLPLVIPRAIVLLIGFINSLVGKITGKSTFINRSKAVEAVRRYWVFSNAKAKSLLSWVPKYTFEQTVAEAGRWYREQKWI